MPEVSPVLIVVIYSSHAACVPSANRLLPLMKETDEGKRRLVDESNGGRRAEGAADNHAMHPSCISNDVA